IDTDAVGHAVTFTMNPQRAVLPQRSVAVQFTVVCPLRKNEPEGGVQVTVTVPEQVSEAVGEKFTIDPVSAGATFTVMSLQPEITGTVASNVIVLETEA